MLPEELVLSRLIDHLEKTIEDRSLIEVILSTSIKDLRLDKESEKLNEADRSLCKESRNNSHKPKWDSILSEISYNFEAPNILEAMFFVSKSLENVTESELIDISSLEAELNLNHERMSNFMNHLYNEKGDAFEFLAPNLRLCISKILFYSLLKISIERLGVRNTIFFVEEFVKLYNSGHLPDYSTDPIVVILKNILYWSENLDSPLDWILISGVSRESGS